MRVLYEISLARKLTVIIVLVQFEIRGKIFSISMCFAYDYKFYQSYHGKGIHENNMIQFLMRLS